MKRGGEDDSDSDSDSPQKRARGTGSEIRILIPSRVAGSVIGKGGGHISRLRNENKATISIPDCPGPERVIQIAAEDIIRTLGVLSELVPLIAEGLGRGNGTVEVRMLFHSTQVGCIIGPGGSRVKELRDVTCTQVKIYGACCPKSTDRIVQVSGRVDRVLKAVKQVALLCHNNPVKGYTDQYDPHNYDEVLAREYGGFGDLDRSDSSYDDHRGPSSSSGGDRSRRSPSSDRSPVSGSKVAEPKGEIQSLISSVAKNGEGAVGEKLITTQVSIPKGYAGAIIGIGGTRIGKIRTDSGAGIKIHEAQQGSADRIISISGTNAQIIMAQYLLQQSVKEFGDKKA